jgi:hypothetical protein
VAMALSGGKLRRLLLAERKLKGLRLPSIGTKESLRAVRAPAGHKDS